MNITVEERAEIVLRNLGEDNRRKVWGWIDTLRQWDTDPFVKEHSKKLDLEGNIYMLITSTEIRIFFKVEEDTITVLDVANKSTILRSGLTSGAGQL